MLPVSRPVIYSQGSIENNELISPNYKELTSSERDTLNIKVHVK